MSEFNADDVIDMAVQEMGARMSDLDRREKIPDHVMIKFLSEANKSAERRQLAKDREQLAVSQLDEVDVVLNSNLPDERKRELLEVSLGKLEQRAKNLRDLLQRGEL